MKKKDKIRIIDAMGDFLEMELEGEKIRGRIGLKHSLSVDDDFATFKRILEIVIDGSQEEKDAFWDAVEKLSGISQGIEALAKSDVVIPESMKGLPKGFSKSDVRILRATCKYEVKALNAFIEACKLGTNWAKACQILPLLNSGESDEVIALKVGLPREWVKKVARNSKAIEAAIFMRFVQADKWWRLSHKGHDLLFDPRWRG